MSETQFTRALRLHFGALAPSLSEQAANQPDGTIFHLPDGDWKKWQDHADAVTRLHLHGLISESVARTARQRIIDRLGKEVRP